MNRRFPLQAVLTHRERQEEQRQLTLALATVALERAQASITLAEQRYATLLVELDQQIQGGTLDVHNIQMLQLQATRTVAQIEALTLERLAAESQVAAAQSAATNASQDRIVMEKLRDAHETQVRQHVAHVESERLGELSLSRWHRRKQTQPEQQ